MTHLLKIPLDLSDLFIAAIDEKYITYQIRDKETGRLLEPPRKSPYMVLEDKIQFDMRFIPIVKAQYAAQLLSSQSP